MSIQILNMSTCNGLQSEGQSSRTEHHESSAHGNGLCRRHDGLLVPVVNGVDDAGNETGKAPSSKSAAATSNCAERPIGRGAFGDVWSAFDPRTGRRVALKRLTHIFSDRHLAIRVLREVICLTSLQHDNILRAVDILQLPSLDEFQDLFLLTESMDSDLYRIIVSNQPLSTTHVKVFVYQILRGLKYLHSAKIIHRDIKPANLLVNANCCLKICDFGLVRDDDSTQAMTQDVSTQYYRAPEMLMGARHYTTSVDVWATGCVLAELLNRRILFQANSPIQQLDLIMEAVGTPNVDDMRFACEAAKSYILRKAPQKSEVNAQALECLSSADYCKEDAVQLLRILLVFNPDKRVTASKALQSNYVKYGRNCYHSTICSCHPSRSKRFKVHDDLPFSAGSDDLEPSMLFPLSLQLQEKLEESPPSVTAIRKELHRLCLEIQEERSQTLLAINTQSPMYQQFQESRAPPKQS